MAIYRDTGVFCLSITRIENFQYRPLLESGCLGLQPKMGHLKLNTGIRPIANTLSKRCYGIFK